jgi:homoserine O-acetyltransferase/O-succinyltransferase
LHKITAPALAILFADDELNPIELGVHQRALAKVRRQEHIVFPATEATEGHRTQVKSEVWASRLATFLSRLPSR